MWLLAVVLLARVLIPAGWMPSSDQGRWISICSGDGKSMAFVDPHGNSKPSAPAHGDHTMQHCVFAGASVTDDLPSLGSALLVPFATVSAPVWPFVQVAIGHGLAAPPPPKTGPPALN